VTIVIPPPVEGDPAGMREFAGVLRGVAQAFGDLGAATQRALGVLGFQGPAANRIRTELGDVSRRLTRRANRLNDLADTVLRTAGQVEDAQNERNRLIALKAQEDALLQKGIHR
jgi:ABC-type transporter Mla subunit MlaD